MTWTGGAGRGAGWAGGARARVEERRELGLAGKSWAAEGSAGPSQGKGEGSGPGFGLGRGLGFSWVLGFADLVLGLLG